MKDVDRSDSCVGSSPDKPIYVAIKGVVFDVSKNKAYQPGGSYHGQSSLQLPGGAAP